VIKFLINRPIAVLAILIAFILLGIISALRMPVSLLPNIDIPEISVRVFYPNIGARQLENSIITSLRRNLLQINGLLDVESETRDGEAVLNLKFNHGTNIHYAYIEANEKIDAMMGTFPHNMPRPTVLKKAASDIPVFYLNITYESNTSIINSLSQLSTYVDDVIKRRIEQLSEVAMVDINGLVTNIVQIKPEKSKMISLGITNDDVYKLLQNNNINYGSLLFKDGQYRYQVRFTSKIRSAEDIANIYLKKDKRIIQIKDFAHVSLAETESEGYNLYNNIDGITLAIYKQPNARMAQMHIKMLELINQLKSDNPHINFELDRDQSALLSYSLKSLKQSLFLGMILAIFIMFFVMRNKKLPWLIAISIPASLIISIFFMDMLSVSINIISLSGLILGVGMMIDNSIIVIDNINQYREKKYTIDDACIAGTNEVIRPLISSVLTTCAVFIPLVFLSGITGALFMDQAITVAISLITSLFISVLLLPVLFRLVHSKKDSYIKLPGRKMKIELLYEKGLLFVLRKKALFLILFFMLIPLGLILFYFVDKQLFPDIEETETLINLEWNEPINPKESKKRLLQLSTSLDTQIKSSTFVIAKPNFMLTGNTSQAETQVLLYFNTDNSSILKQLKNEFKATVNLLYPDAIINFLPTDNVFHSIFNDDIAPLIAKVRIQDSNHETNVTYASIANTISIINNEGGKKQSPVFSSSYIVNVNFNNLLLYDVDFQQLIIKLKALLSKYKVGSMTVNNKYIDIVIVSDKLDLYTLINNEYIRNGANQLISINALVSISEHQVLKTIKSDKLGEYYPVDVGATLLNYSAIIKNINKLYKNNNQVTLSWVGSIFDSIDLFYELVFVLLVSLLLLYFILAAQFESLIQPIIVLLEVMFDISGVLIMLVIFNSSLNIMSAIGIVVMSGIVINDSILKIDTINRLYRAGATVKESVIMGGSRRFKPIVMTSITTILALVPMLFLSGMGIELQLPLALAVIGGLFVGTFVSLFFIPAFYLLVYNKNKEL
jgi:multidrug efflux pump subunit AcrB